LKAVIMAGGKGTRISSVSDEIPKTMLPVAGKPVLELQIKCLKSHGYKDIIIVTGHLGGFVHAYFGNGENFGVNIEYYHETKPLGTAGALAAIKKILIEDFFLINGDLVFDVDLKRFESFHRSRNALATLFTHPNDHPFDSEIIVTDSNSKITGWISREDKSYAFKNRVNAGIHILSPQLLSHLKPVRLDLDKDILLPSIDSGRLFAYNSPEYVKDMGTPERYEQVCRDFTSGVISARNLHHKQKAIFLDRDGTLNEYHGLITKTTQIKLIEGVAEALVKINKSRYLAIVITNQPVIARGDCTIEELGEINNRLEYLIGKEGAYLDDLYYCPHHPDEGYKGEIAQYKISCECRKPKPGLILQAAKDYNIDLEQSFMVGDDIKDVLAGKAAGCKTAFLLSGKAPTDPVNAPVYLDLADFTDKNII